MIEFYKKMSLSKQAAGNRWKGKYDDSRKFKPEWQKYHPWVKKAIDGSENAYCTFCRVDVNPRLSHLKQHDNIEKHKKLASGVSSTRKIYAPSKFDNEMKRIELEFAVSVTCHCAISSIDRW